MSRRPLPFDNMAPTKFSGWIDVDADDDVQSTVFGVSRLWGIAE